MEQRNGMNKTILCITKVLQFAEYIRLQLRCITKQLINMHNVFLCTLKRINCKHIDVQTTEE